MVKAYGLSLADCKELLRDAPTYTTKPKSVRAVKMKTIFAVEKPSGVMRGEPGDYLIYDEHGDFFGKGEYCVAVGHRFENTFVLKKE